MRNFLRHAVGILSLAAISAHAQAPEMKAKAEAGRPKPEVLQSPMIQSQVKMKRFDPRDWLEFEAAIKLQVAPKPRSEMVDRLTVKWYVAVKNPDKPNEFFLLTRDVQHANVPVGEEIYTSIYLSPSSVRRLTGNYRANPRAIEMIGYEVVFNGQVIEHAASQGSKPEWWKIPSDRISATDTIPLLTRPETPFASMWWDRYAEVVTEANK